MKWTFGAFVAVALAVAGLSIPAPLFSSDAQASRMNGKGMGCSDGMNCMAARHKAATMRARKSKK